MLKVWCCAVVLLTERVEIGWIAVIIGTFPLFSSVQLCVCDELLAVHLWGFSQYFEGCAQYQLLSLFSSETLTLPLIQTTSRGAWLPCCHFHCCFSWLDPLIFPLPPPSPVFICFFLCLLSDSFSGTNLYRNSALFHSEPPALAGLFRGTYLEVEMRNPAHKSSF